MGDVKNKKTKVFFGAGVPTTKTLAAAKAIATVGFGCTVTSMNGLDFTRGTTSDDAVYCDHDGDFSMDDTDDLKISPWTMEGKVKAGTDSAEYAAAHAVANGMIISDTEGVFVVTEPDPDDGSPAPEFWFQAKMTKLSKPRGGANEKQKFNLEAIPRSMPKDS